MQFTSATTTKTEIEEAVRELAQTIRQKVDLPEFDFVIVFVSPHFARAALFVADKLREALAPRVLIGCTCEGIIGRDREIENEPAISVVAAQMPNVQLVPFTLEPEAETDGLSDQAQFTRLVGAPADTKLFLMLADPFSTPMDQVLSAFNSFYPNLPIIGGMASGAQRSRGNTLLLNERALHSGVIGIAMAGNFSVDTVVSQGCRPIGPALKVTQARENLLLTLDDEPALPMFRKIAEGLSEPDRELLQNGLFIGRLITLTPSPSPVKRERGEGYGRGDFLIRGVMGADPDSGAIAVGDLIQVGETIQFHVRDQATAQEDLELLLMPQVFDAPPQGALLFSCNGRGTRLYDHPNGDISVIQKILGGVDLAGFFCAGEIGPIGEKNFLHGHTASMVMFRPESG